jgi:transcriptional regulator with XRE-family HTH domain
MAGSRNLAKFAGHLRELREKRGMTQTGLAELAGLNRNYVGDVERGYRNPCLDNIVKLADALDVNASELFRPFDKRP